MKIPNKCTAIDRRGLTYEEWLQGRNIGLGGSDAGTVLGLNDYQSALELYHYKCGVINRNKPDTISTMSGKVLEDVIYQNYWKHYDPANSTMEVLVDNWSKKNVIRTAKRKNFTLINPEFPWLLANLDYIMDAHDNNPKGGILDIKNSLGYVMKQYEGDISPHYVIQTQTYMLITGFDYSELGYFVDGRYFNCMPIPANPSLQESILRETKEFWQRVEQGKKIWARTDLSETDRMQALVEYEPEITGSSALEDYLKERYKSTYKAGRMVGTQDILECAVRYLKCTERMNEIDAEKTLEGNMLRKLFLDHKIDEIMFSDEKNKEKALISYRMNEGKPAVLRVSKELLKLV